MLAEKLCGSGAPAKLYVDDVFSTYLYTGNGSTQTINNGIDLAGKGGMVWTKSRRNTISNAIQDTLRGGDSVLQSDKTDQAQNLISNSFSSSGYTLGSDYGNGLFNYNTYTYASWTFRKAPKFFDVVTYTGNGIAGRQIPHTLGIAPGMLIVKCTNTGWDWRVYHCNLANTEYMVLNSADAKATGATIWNSTAPTASEFTVGSDSSVNGADNTYVAYLFAHDTSADGIIQCGSFTTDGSGNATVNLGWEPQFGIIKAASTAFDWYIMDSMRGMPVEGSSLGQLFPNTSGAETSGTRGMHPTATGFVATGFTASSTQIYLAIHRPNKPPTTGAEVFQPVVYTGNGVDNRLVNTTIAPDMVMVRERNDTTPLGMAVAARLMGNSRLQTSSTAIEITDADSFMTPTVGYGNSFSAMNGFGVGDDSTSKLNNDTTANNHIALAFKRAPGFFDVVCYTGDGTSTILRKVNHSLQAVPELLITKDRSGATEWGVGTTTQGVMSLNSTVLAGTGINGYCSSTDYSPICGSGPAGVTNASGITYVSYLFATLPSISKVGTYVGNNGTQTIPCGFTTGARFVLIKRTDSTGDWFVWDTARNIIEGNDPHLSLNSTAAEVTTNDSIDPDTSGFKVNQVAATNINVNLATYIFLAIS